MQRRLRYVYSLRKMNNEPSFKTVFEWEDIIAKMMNLSFRYDSFIHRYKYCARIEKYGPINLYHKLIKYNTDIQLYFDMTAETKSRCILDKNTIPVIIDFWLTKEQLPAFYNTYKHCPVVIVTSAEVFAFLKANNCPLPIEHWPLSLPDSISVKSLDKKYDFCFIGRKDPFFVEMVKLYTREHPNFKYVINNDDINNREYTFNNGEFISKDTGRESYLNIIRSSKICVYSTPGIDKAKDVLGRFNQVTPRLLELLSGGCYVLGHYLNNPDTEYYNLESIVPQINNYENFCKYMDLYRNSPARDLDECKSYIEHHYTSSRIEMLKSILHKFQIDCK